MKVKVVKDSETGRSSYWLWCPACVDAVRIDDTWAWDGNLVYPTFSPSLLTKSNRDGIEVVCHSFIRSGIWDFLTDSTHNLSGKLVPMVELPDWLALD